MTIKISFIHEKCKFANNIWWGVPKRPWVLGVNLEREGVWFEPVLNIHTPFRPNLIPKFVILYIFSTNVSDEWQHLVYFFASSY
jgi:hypothetical protein